MRFKAKLAPEQVALLYQLVVPISKLSGSGVEGSKNHQSGGCWMTRNGSMLRLDDTHLQLSTAGRTQDTDGITCFAELATNGFNSIFLEKIIESAAPHNAIVMELDLVQLRMALKSVLGGGGTSAAGDHHHDLMGGAAAAAGTSQTVLKLAKRNNIPCLCIDAVAPGATLIQVHHAIPVRIRKHQEMQNHLPPPHAVPDVQLELVSSATTSTSTSIAPLRTIVEKLKPLSPVLYLEANTTGELTVSAYQDGASVQAFFSKLKARHFSNNNNNSNQQNGDGNHHNSQKTATVKMDTKKLWVALQGLQHPQQAASQAVLCLVENELVVVHVSLPHGVGFFTYYVPVHFLQEGGGDDDGSPGGDGE